MMVRKVGGLEIRGTTEGGNTRDYQFGGCCLCSTAHPLLSLTEANIHFRSAISNVTGPLLAQGNRTKVYPPFKTSTLSPGLLMNITDRFTEKLKMLAASIHPLPAVSQEDDDPQRKCFLLRASPFLECPSSYRPCNRKWDVPS